MKSLLFSRKGQAMVEMALILPILMLILLGITEFGRILGGYLEMQSMTRDLARYVSINNNITSTDTLYFTRDDSGDNFCIEKSDGSKITINEHFILLEPEEITVAVNSQSDANNNKWVGVTLTYSMDLMTPFIGDAIGDPFDMISTMTMRVE